MALNWNDQPKQKGEWTEEITAALKYERKTIGDLLMLFENVTERNRSISIHTNIYNEIIIVSHTVIEWEQTIEIHPQKSAVYGYDIDYCHNCKCTRVGGFCVTFPLDSSKTYSAFHSYCVFRIFIQIFSYYFGVAVFIFVYISDFPFVLARVRFFSFSLSFALSPWLSVFTSAEKWNKLLFSSKRTHAGNALKHHKCVRTNLAAPPPSSLALTATLASKQSSLQLVVYFTQKKMKFCCCLSFDIISWWQLLLSLL